LASQLLTDAEAANRPVFHRQVKKAGEVPLPLLSLILILNFKIKVREQRAWRARPMDENHQLNLRSGALVMTPHLNDQPQKWLRILRALALDKRQDLDESVLVLWQLKLAKYPEADVQQVLIEGHWKLFPDCDEVIDALDRIQEERRFAQEEEKRQREKAEAETARENWEDPAQAEWLAEQAQQLADKLSLSPPVIASRRFLMSVRPSPASPGVVMSKE